VIELHHDSHGCVLLEAAHGTQTFMFLPDMGCMKVPGFSDMAEELLEWGSDIGDDPEYKMKATHFVAGPWRGMLAGPRLVVWNRWAPDTELHLTDDGCFLIGDAGRAVQVVAHALCEERHKMWFLNTDVALRMLAERYRLPRAEPLWEWKRTVDEFAEKQWIKVFRYEEAPHPDLGLLTDAEFDKYCKVRCGASLSPARLPGLSLLCSRFPTGVMKRMVLSSRQRRSSACRATRGTSARRRRRSGSSAARPRRAAATSTEPPPPRTKWTRRVPHPVLSGHAVCLVQVRNPRPHAPAPPPAGVQHRAQHLGDARPRALGGPGGRRAPLARRSHLHDDPALQAGAAPARGARSGPAARCADMRRARCVETLEPLEPLG
jgi:hypothetical protein